MTEQEARKTLGLEDYDKIYMPGLLDVEASLNERLKVWSLPEYMKKEIKEELEAITVLKGEK